MVKGIDVSKHQGKDIVYSLAPGDGIEFVIARAGYAWVNDSKFEYNIHAARAEKMLVGGYWAFWPDLGAKRQAELFWSQIEKAGGVDLPLAIDVERRWIGETKARSRERLFKMIERLGQLTEHELMIYTSEWAWSNSVGLCMVNLPLWVCDVDDVINLPYGWDDWLFWQTGQERFPWYRQGTARLDVNVFNGSRTDLLMRFGPNVEPPPDYTKRMWVYGLTQGWWT